VLVAVLSDIHSNVHALQAVLRDVEIAGAGEVWVCGDTFGYYPWAAESFWLLNSTHPVAVLGNHDSWVAGRRPSPSGIIGEAARHNATDLAARAPEALDWLAGLSPSARFERAGRIVTMAHGTPDDPLDGRYYPDDTVAHEWLPRRGQILVLGQTHYPLVRGEATTGLLVNPGSVGQPRDSKPMPSWALLDLATGSAELRRTSYDNAMTMARLRSMRWDERITAALDKR
jgi:predicted phosphodiesterase